jgi:uncharacterized membrane protein
MSAMSEPTDNELPPRLERKLFKVFIGWMSAATVLLGLLAAGAAYLIQKSVVEEAKNEAIQLALNQELILIFYFNIKG